MTSYRHFVRIFPGSVNLNKTWKFCWYILIFFYVYGTNISTASELNCELSTQCLSKQEQKFVFFLISISRNIIKSHYQHYAYLWVQVVFRSILSLPCLFCSRYISEPPEIQYIQTWLVLHCGELHLPDSNSWRVKSDDFLPKTYGDQYVTSEVSAKGSLKEVYMLHCTLCEIWHL